MLRVETAATVHTDGVLRFHGVGELKLDDDSITAGVVELSAQTNVFLKMGFLTLPFEQNRVDVSGPVAFAGHLNILLDETFRPDIGDEYEIFTFTDRGGTVFDTVTGVSIDAGLSFALFYSDTNLLLRATVPGDLDGDDVVSVADLSTFALNFNTTPGPGSWQKGDFNDDGDITVADLSLLALNFGFELGVSEASGLSLEDVAALVGINLEAVPEPHSALVVCLGVIASLARRRHT